MYFLNFTSIFAALDLRIIVLVFKNFTDVYRSRFTSKISINYLFRLVDFSYLRA